MSRFIRLTSFLGDPVHVNADRIEVVADYYYFDGKAGSEITIGENHVQVKESPSEVLRMIEGEEVSIPHFPYYDPLHKIYAHIADLEARNRRNDDDGN